MGSLLAEKGVFSNVIGLRESTPMRSPWKEKVALVGRRLSEFPQTEMPLKHYFAPHVYIREIFMPARTIVIGKIHKTEHFNIIQKGKVTLVSEDGSRTTLEGPCTFVSKPGVQKVLYIHEDTVWSTVHSTDTREPAELELELVEPDAAYTLLGPLFLAAPSARLLDKGASS
ncbi:MAG: hypothetical protein ACYDB1_01210 [Acidiferrobacteraceae bacterium]